MSETIAKLQEAAKSNDGLRKALADAGSDLDKIVAAANAHGVSITKADLESAIAAAKSKGALGKDDLDKAAGGTGSVSGIIVEQIMGIV